VALANCQSIRPHRITSTIYALFVSDQLTIVKKLNRFDIPTAEACMVMAAPVAGHVITDVILMLAAVVTAFDGVAKTALVATTDVTAKTHNRQNCMTTRHKRVTVQQL
jgi:hypothetical protein